MAALVTFAGMKSRLFLFVCAWHFLLVAAGAAGSGEIARLSDLRGVWQAAFNQDASRVLVRLRNGEIALWEVEAGTRVAGELKSPATGFVMDAKGSLALVGYADGSRVFEMTSGRAIGPLLPEKLLDNVTEPAVFSPDGRTVVIFGHGTVTIWNCQSGERRAAIPFPAGPDEEATGSAIFAAGGAVCFLMDPNGTVTRYDTSNWKPVGQPMRHPRLEMAYEFAATASEDGKWLATFDGAGENGPKGQLQIWDARAGKPLGAPLVNTNGFSARFLAGTDRVLVLPARGEAAVRALPTMKMLYKIPAHDEIDGPRAQLSPDGKWILAWGSDRIINVHDAATGKIAGGSAEKATIRNVLVPPDSSACFVVYDNSTFATEKYQDFYVTRMALPDMTMTAAHRSLDFVRGAALSPDGRRVLFFEGGDEAERLIILDATNLEPLAGGK